MSCNQASGGPSSGEDAKQQRDVRVVHETCDLQASSAERLDANGDGRADITVVQSGGRPECQAADLNFDGVIDTWTYYEGGSTLRRREHDFDRDGKIDEIVVFKGGVISEKQRVTAIPGQLDTWEFYANGQLARTERDSDGDANVDQWWEYTQPGCPMMHTDANHDGRPDPGASIDYCKETGYVPPERQSYRQAESPDFKPQQALPTEEEVKEVPEGSSESKPSSGEKK